MNLPHHLIYLILNLACDNIVDRETHVQINHLTRNWLYYRRKSTTPSENHMLSIRNRILQGLLTQKIYSRYLLRWEGLRINSESIFTLVGPQSEVACHTPFWDLVFDTQDIPRLESHVIQAASVAANDTLVSYILAHNERVAILRPCEINCLAKIWIRHEASGFSNGAIRILKQLINQSRVLQDEVEPFLLEAAIRSRSERCFEYLVPITRSDVREKCLLYYISYGKSNTPLAQRLFKVVPPSMRLFQTMLEAGREAYVLQYHYDHSKWLSRQNDSDTDRLLYATMNHRCMFRFMLSITCSRDPQALLHRALEMESSDNIGAVLREYPKIGPNWDTLRYDHVWICHIVTWFDLLEIRTPLGMIPKLLWDGFFKGFDEEGCGLSCKMRVNICIKDGLILRLLRSHRIPPPTQPLRLLKQLVYGGYSAELLEASFIEFPSMVGYARPHITAIPLLRYDNDTMGCTLLHYYIILRKEHHCMVLAKVFPEITLGRMTNIGNLGTVMDLFTLANRNRLLKFIDYMLDQGRVCLTMEHVQTMYRRAVLYRRREVEDRTPFEDRLLMALSPDENIRLDDWLNIGENSDFTRRRSRLLDPVQCSILQTAS